MSPLPPPVGQTASQQPLSGRKVVLAGLVCGAAGLAIALFLRAIVANTTVRLSSRELFWSTVLMGGFGVVAGMALAAVRQLQQSSIEPEYHRHRALRQHPEPRRGATDDRERP
ncbi:hypothetical protein NZK33_18855 [Cyanobium sp. FGCU-6]|nr:hypothetical protein [Cyanobium sp. FGCU6]